MNRIQKTGLSCFSGFFFCMAWVFAMATAGHAQTGGPGGHGPGGRNPMCENDQQLCDIMQELHVFCGKNESYCLQTRKREKRGGKDQPPGEKPDKARLQAMKKEMDDPAARKKIKESLKEQLAFARGLKSLCEKGDKDACEKARQARDFFVNNAEQVRSGADAAKTNGMLMEAELVRNQAHGLMPLINDCMKSGDACKARKAALSDSMARIKVLRDDCAKDKKKCDAFRNGVMKFGAPDK